MDGIELNKRIDELLSKVKSYNPHVHSKIIENALRFSDKIHEGRKRDSGQDHVMHDYEIGSILADLKLDSHTIASGILHDALEYGVKPESIVREFDQETLDLIASVTKLKLIDKNLTFEQEKERRAENLRKILLATSKDIRVILIKLADRLHNMRTLKHLPDDRRRIIARETMDIYAPIAHKLGMYNMKAELEDWSFRFLEPKIYNDIKEKVASKKLQREKEIARIINFVKDELKKSNIEAEVQGRAKHFFSIYKKIVGENKHFDEIYDLMAIRIIADDLNDCYSALGIVHNLWKPMPGRLKDYIAMPKPNGYQSLHTGVMIAPGKVLEIQIRDRTMHRAAEEGIASHWRYKGDEQDKKFDRQLEWLKQILEWKRTSDAQDFIESLKIDLFQKEMFVFTPKGDPISLPENATPVDFAYGVHTDIGNHCKQAKVNGNIVPLDSTLHPGDIIEILTVKDVVASRAWLGFVRSIHTKAKIKHVLNIFVDTKKKKDKDYEEPEEGFGQSIIHEGKKYDIKIPKCCNPRMSDDIKAFKTKDGKIVIHKAGCINIHSMDIARQIELKMKEPEMQTIPLRIDVLDRIGVLAEILNFIAKQGINVKSLNTRWGKDGRVLITIDMEKTDAYEMDELIRQIKKTESVINAYVEER
jgi:GTP pyrophosphokinase